MNGRLSWSSLRPLLPPGSRALAPAAAARAARALPSPRISELRARDLPPLGWSALHLIRCEGGDQEGQEPALVDVHDFLVGESSREDEGLIEVAVQGQSVERRLRADDQIVRVAGVRRLHRSAALLH